MQSRARWQNAGGRFVFATVARARVGAIRSAISSPAWEKTMKTQRLLVVLTFLNFGLLAFLLAQTRVHIGLQGVRVWTNNDGSVLRGRALEITDDQGRTRASINLHQADQGASYPETVVLRLIDQNGRPSVQLSTSERGGLPAV